MAPVAPEKPRPPVNNSYASKKNHGRVLNSSRGRIAANYGTRSTFHSTRVIEPVSSDEAGVPQGDLESINDGEGSSSLHDSESDDTVGDELEPTNSYHTLLQSLNAQHQSRPPRKKRRMHHLDAPEEPKSIQNHEQVAKDAFDVANFGVDETEDETDSDKGALTDEVEDDPQEDPFSKHLTGPNETQLDEQIKAAKCSRMTRAKVVLPSGTLCSAITPEGDHKSQSRRIVKTTTVEELQIKQKLRSPATRLLSTLKHNLDDLAFPMFNYVDLLYAERNTLNAESLRRLSCIHVLNHLFKTRDKVLKNNAKLAKNPTDVDLEFRDQGFTRPKVLIVLPTRASCAKWLEIIISLCGPEQQENMKRFQESYIQAEDTLSEEKPDDFRELFGGNDDDLFRLGIKFTRKSIKYFSQFYASDIIFASPLGLRMAIGAEDDKKQDYDFLSSIEITIVDQANSLMMQNWEHVDFIFDHLNLQPREAHGCDFSRVRNWYLDGNAKFLRQTMLFSAFNFPALNRLYLRQTHNIAGRLIFSKQYEGAIVRLSCPVKQTFSRFEYRNPLSEPDDRFLYFTTAIVPALVKLTSQGRDVKQGILVYLPSYADFVRVRNYLATSSTTQNISFGSISEYTSVRDVARARSHFLSGRHSVLIYTERAHHFRRHHLRGVRRIIMYGLPDNPTFYEEIVGGFLGTSIRDGSLNTGEASSRGLFSKLDILKLERIVGSTRISSLLRDTSGDTFEFV